MYVRFQASPRKSHLKATKRILRYLKHTQNAGLWYSKGAKFELVGYSDSDYTGCKVERKSTSGTCQLLGRSLDSWSSKKQNSVALSTTEAKYISAGSCCAQKGDICIESVGTEDQLADIFTKPLDEKSFCKLRNELNILNFSNMC